MADPIQFEPHQIRRPIKLIWLAGTYKNAEDAMRLTDRAGVLALWDRLLRDKYKMFKDFQERKDPIALASGRDMEVTDIRDEVEVHITSSFVYFSFDGTDCFLPRAMLIDPLIAVSVREVYLEKESPMRAQGLAREFVCELLSDIANRPEELMQPSQNVHKLNPRLVAGSVIWKGFK